MRKIARKQRGKALMPKAMDVFASRLRQARKKAGLTQLQLANLVGLKTQAALMQYERGRVSPSLETLRQMAIILNVSLDWLLGMDKQTGGNNHEAQHQAESHQ